MRHLVSYKLFESMVSRKKDDQIFNYRSVIESKWRSLIKKAQDFQKIHFDLENNDSTGEKKTLYIKKDLRKDQPVKYEFNIELYKAGGDWEMPVMYFRIEFTTDYSVVYGRKELEAPEYVWDLDGESYDGLYKHYVLIPGPDINKLEKRKDGYGAFSDNGSPKSKDYKLTEEDLKKAWKWVEDVLTKVVDERHKMLDSPENKVDAGPAEPAAE